jgi:DNA-binding NarL/FixJ family response regulator
MPPVQGVVFAPLYPSLSRFDMDHADSFPPSQHAIEGPVLVLEDLAEPRAWLCGLVTQAWEGANRVDEAMNLQQARSCLQVQTYSVALVDWELPDGNAGALIADICQRNPETLVIVSTIHDDDERVFAALRAGAQGYVLKSQPRQTVLAQLRAIERGEPALTPSIAHKVLAYFRQRTQAPVPGAVVDETLNLSPRELDVLRLIAKGYRNAEAAELLGMTVNTVSSYIKVVYRKLGVSSRAEAALEASRLGLAR